MSTTQASLKQFRDRYEWTTKKFVKTVIFDLRDPSARKQERIDRAIESAEAIRAETARRMPSIPKRYWATAKPKNSTFYEWAKELDSHLSNKDVHENIQSVRETFRSWQSSGYDGDKPETELFANAGACSFYYGKPKYKRHDGSYYVSLPLAAGRGERELLPLRDGAYLREYANQIRNEDLKKGRAELMRDGDTYALHQVVRTEVDVIADPKTTVGVDVGLTNLAAVGAIHDGEKVGANLWSGSEAAEMRARFSEQRAQAQRERRYEDLREQESRYVENVCHTVSRDVVDWALQQHRPEIVLEDLTDIRDTFIRREREHTAEERRALHSWAFDKRQTMIEYKALEEGIPTRKIDPAYTSEICNECGEQESADRDGVHFSCESCGYEVNADVNGAFNIAMVD